MRNFFFLWIKHRFRPEAAGNRKRIGVNRVRKVAYPGSPRSAFCFTTDATPKARLDPGHEALVNPAQRDCVLRQLLTGHDPSRRGVRLHRGRGGSRETVTDLSIACLLRYRVKKRGTPLMCAHTNACGPASL